jgi:hypothetical protein
MGSLERLDDPIDTPMGSHDDWHKEEHKKRGTCLRMGSVGLRDMMVDGCKGSFGCIESTEGCDQSFECGGLRRGVIHPKDDVSHW